MGIESCELILSVTTEGFWDWNLKSDRASLSQKYCELVGYSADDTVFDSNFFKSIIHPDDREHVFATIQEHLHGKSDIALIEYRMISRDGTIIWIQGRGKIVEYDEQGTPLRMVGTIIDITKRKQVEGDLKESEFFFKESQRSASIGSYKTDFIAGYWKSSEVLDNIFGIDRNYDRSVQGWLDLVHPDDRAIMNQYVKEEVISKRKPFSKEYRIIRKNDGETRWVNGLGEVKFDSDGNILSMYGTIQDITERKRMEEALHESHTLLNEVMDGIPDPIYIKDLDSRILFANKALAQVVGKPIEEIIGRTDSEYYGNPAIGLVLREHDQRVIESKLSETTEETVSTPSGARTFLSSKVPYCGSTGDIIGIIGVSRDITDQKARDNALLESEAREKARANELEALMEAVPSMVIIARDPDCRIITGNHKAHELMHIPPGGNFSKSAPDDERPGHFRIYKDGVVTPVLELPVQRAARGEEIRDYEQEFVFEDGTRLTLLGNATPLREVEGQLRGAVAAYVDITERKKMEKALLESEEQFRTLSNFAPIGIFKSDCTGNNVYMNPRWEEITGISAQEGMGQGWIKAVHPDDRGEISKIWLEATETGGNYALECRLLTAQKETVWVRTLARPLKGPDGSFAGFVGTVEDITELQRIKQDMLKTEKLESLGILAGGIAHDFNNILSAILGNISLARVQAHDPEKVAQRLEEAENAAVRAKDLTLQLLTFARGGDPVKKVIKVSSLLIEAAGFASHGSVVKCKFVLADDLWPIEADEGQLSQVIHNLVLNAIQAMPNGGKITIVANNAETPSGGNKFVKISVADTGTGIPEDLLPKIFDPYFTTKQQGSGLGLASCFSIITKHDGKIRVESTLGKGTTFHISLPATEELEETEPAACLEVVRGKGRVLVMDDDEMVREILIESLEELGYLVECTENGSAAVELYRKRQGEGTPFAAVIMDLTIPGGIGGKEAISSLIQIDPHVKAIVSSGYATDPIMANCREYGFSGVLSKPYRLQELNKILQELLKD